MQYKPIIGPVLPNTTIMALQIAWKVRLTAKYVIIITGPPNAPVLYCSLASVVVCNAAGRQAGRPPGGRHSTTGQSCYVSLGRHLDLYYSTQLNHKLSAFG